MTSDAAVDLDARRTPRLGIERFCCAARSDPVGEPQNEKRCGMLVCFRLWMVGHAASTANGLSEPALTRN